MTTRQLNWPRGLINFDRSVVRGSQHLSRKPTLNLQWAGPLPAHPEPLRFQPRGRALFPHALPPALPSNPCPFAGFSKLNLFKLLQARLPFVRFVRIHQYRPRCGVESTVSLGRLNIPELGSKLAESTGHSLQTTSHLPWISETKAAEMQIPQIRGPLFC